MRSRRGETALRVAVVLAVALVGLFGTLNALLALLFELSPFPGQGTSDLAAAGYAAGALAGVAVPVAVGVLLLRRRPRWGVVVGVLLAVAVVLAVASSGLAGLS